MEVINVEHKFIITIVLNKEDKDMIVDYINRTNPSVTNPTVEMYKKIRDALNM